MKRLPTAQELDHAGQTYIRFSGSGDSLYTIIAQIQLEAGREAFQRIRKHVARICDTEDPTADRLKQLFEMLGAKYL